MRRVLAILLLLSLTLQSVWGAAEPYCQHEQGRAAQHLGHHVHDLVAHDDAHDDDGSAAKQAKAKAMSAADQGHHCCSALGVLPLGLADWPVADWPSTRHAEPAHAYRSALSGRIDRPNWPPSL